MGAPSRSTHSVDAPGSNTSAHSHALPAIAPAQVADAPGSTTSAHSHAMPAVAAEAPAASGPEPEDPNVELKLAEARRDWEMQLEALRKVHGCTAAAHNHE